MLYITLKTCCTNAVLHYTKLQQSLHCTKVFRAKYRCYIVIVFVFTNDIWKIQSRQPKASAKLSS